MSPIRLADDDPRPSAASEAPGSPVDPHAYVRPAAALVVLSFLFRLVDLGRLAVWEDEAATWFFALRTTSGQDLLHWLGVEPTPPLHYVLVGLLLRVFGDTDWMLRLPSAVFGALSVGAVFLLGRRLFRPAVGFGAALWLAVHPWHLSFSREGRAYALLLLLTLLLWRSLWRALEQDRTRDWALTALFLALACWTHFYGLFLGFTVGVLILGFGRSWRIRIRGMTAAAVAGLVFAPYLLFSLPHLEKSGADWSVARLYELRPEIASPGWIAEGQAVGAKRNPFARRLAQPPTPDVLWVPAVGVQGLLAVLALVLAPWDLRRRLFLAGLWLLPILLPWAFSVLERPLFHPGRHDFFILGASALLVAAGFHGLVVRFRRPAARRAAAAVLVLAVAPALLFRLAWLHVLPADDGPRAAAAWIAENAAGTPVVATGIRRLRVERYLRPTAGEEIRSFPSSTDLHPGWADPRDLVTRPRELAEDARRLVTELGPEAERLVVLARPYPEPKTVRSESWDIDRHLFEALGESGYRPLPGSEETREHEILVFERHGG